jgi:hypothetical protein
MTTPSKAMPGLIGYLSILVIFVGVIGPALM